MRKLSPAENFVAYALSIGALEILPNGRELKSGRLSPYFFNSGLFNSGQSAYNLSLAYAMQIAESFEPDVIYGPAYKGIPLCATIAMQYFKLTGKNVDYVFNRKEVKNHGEGGTLVGLPPGKDTFEGRKVLIVDDVMTTDGSCNEAHEIITTYDGLPHGCVIGFDRQEIAIESELSAVQEFENKHNLLVRAAATLKNLIDLLTLIPPESGDDENGEILEAILSYQRSYGVTS